jgi:hypothetical protein
MAYEINAWKKPNCSLTVNTNKLSERIPYSQEINEAYGEGGALNADYQTAEAIAVVSNLLGFAGLLYERDFVFKTGSGAGINFDFKDQTTKETARKTLQNYL